MICKIHLVVGIINRSNTFYPQQAFPPLLEVFPERREKYWEGFLSGAAAMTSQINYVCSRFCAFFSITLCSKTCWLAPIIILIILRSSSNILPFSRSSSWLRSLEYLSWHSLMSCNGYKLLYFSSPKSSTPNGFYLPLIYSQIDWRKAKKEKIHRIYDEYQKPSFPSEVQASKLDESSATNFPREIWSGKIKPSELRLNVSG